MDDFVVYPDSRLNRAAVPRPVDAAMLEGGAALQAAAAGVEANGLAATHIGQVESLVVISVAGQGMAWHGARLSFAVQPKGVGNCRYVGVRP
ncbi:MAG: hypothetical protein MO852_15655 [Candidatus Devosia euplotis]|nr:hypothetical protein [Candidatus Devosia euplotis]